MILPVWQRLRTLHAHRTPSPPTEGFFPAGNDGCWNASINDRGNWARDDFPSPRAIHANPEIVYDIIYSPNHVLYIIMYPAHTSVIDLLHYNSVVSHVVYISYIILLLRSRDSRYTHIYVVLHLSPATHFIKCKLSYFYQCPSKNYLWILMNTFNWTVRCGGIYYTFPKMSMIKIIE